MITDGIILDGLATFTVQNPTNVTCEVLGDLLPRPQLAHCANPTRHHHPHPPFAPPVLGRGPTVASTPKYLAGNLGKLFAVKFLLLNSRRHQDVFCLR